MAEESAIAWTKSTFNPWIGCTKVGPGCDHCYAEALDGRYKWGGAAHWGPGVARMRTKPGNWAKPLRWNKDAPASEFAGRKGFWPVFCASLADVFDNEVPLQWRADLFALIRATPNLEWLLVTKRIGNAASMLAQLGHFGGPPALYQIPGNVRILITVVNQEEADRDVPKLLAMPCKNGISYEPALGSVDWTPWLFRPMTPAEEADYARQHNITRPFIGHMPSPRLDWIIVGGESSQAGHPAREFRLSWVERTIKQCRTAGVPVFVKQMGSNLCIDRQPYFRFTDMKDRAGADPDEWPEEFRVREFPR